MIAWYWLIVVWIVTEVGNLFLFGLLSSAEARPHPDPDEGREAAGRWMPHLKVIPDEVKDKLREGWDQAEGDKVLEGVSQ